jgi:heme-degrading monooxygenase HmoA
MIVRAWRGYASTAAPDAYPKHLLENVRPNLERLSGFQGLTLLRRHVGAEIEYLVLTLWESMDAVRAFAGEDPERAVVEPEARAALTRFDEQVTHYDVLAGSGVQPASRRG